MSVSKKDFKRILQSVIEVNDNAVVNVLLMIYERQTYEEQVNQDTIEDNGMGFNGTDGEILSSFSAQYLQKGYLSTKQIEMARKKVKKYWGQVLSILGNDLSTITTDPGTTEHDITEYNPQAEQKEPEAQETDLYLWK